MKTQISKLFFVFGAGIIYFGLFSPLLVNAQQTTFNTLPNDRPTIQVSNYTQNPGCSTCWSNSVSANPGDTISVYVYYHNTGTVTANNTKLKLSVPQGYASSTHSITGSVSANNASQSSGAATININGSQTLTFDGYIKWYPDHDAIYPDPIPFGQTGGEVFTASGLNIGNIAPDSPFGSFSTQGSLVVRFKVSSTATPPPPPPPPVQNCVINSFTANPSTVSYGSFSSLNWNTTNCSYVTLNGGIFNNSSQNSNGSASTGALNQSTNFTLTAYGNTGPVQQTVSVTVTGIPSLICSISNFYTDNSSVSYGGNTTLRWYTNNCSSVSISGGGMFQSGLSPNSSIITNALFSSTTFVLTATGQNGGDTKQITVNVSQAPIQNCVINSFTANPSTVSYGSFSSLNWNTTNCSYVTLNGGIFNNSSQNSNGSASTGALNQSTNFTLTAYGNTGPAQQTVFVNVTGQPAQNCVINSFNANPNPVSYGNSSTLSWNTTNCSSVSIYGGNVNQSGLNSSGNINTGSLYNNTNFNITAYGSNGSVTSSVFVNVNGSGNGNLCRVDYFYASPNRVDEGEKTTLYWGTTNCNNVNISNGIGNVSQSGNKQTARLYNDETFTISANGNNSSDSKTITVRVDENNNNNDYCQIDEFYASPSTVSYGNSSRIYWETTDCDSVSISGFGSVSRDGDRATSALYSTTYFTISAYGNGSNDSRTLTIGVNQIINPPVYTPSTIAVTTLGVQNVTRTSADLVGVLASTGVGSNSVWFEWGTAQTLGFSTSQSAYSGSVNTTFTKTLVGLSPDTLYYFKAIGSGSGGSSEGVIRFFRTLGAVTPTNTNTVVYINSGTGESLVDLNLTSSFENVSTGESFEIKIKYINTSSTVTAKEAVLTVILPKNLLFEKISRGDYNKSDHMIFTKLEDIGPKEEGEIILKVKVSNKAENGELLATVGTLNYKKGNGNKEEVVDVLTNKVTSDGSVLGAFALGGGFWPNSLIGWLIFIIIFMLIVYLAQKMFHKKGQIAQPISVPPLPPQNYR